MTSRKRFNIPQDLAQGIRTTVQVAANNSGQLQYDFMALKDIERDPHNPRKLSITLEDLQQEPQKNDPLYTIKLQEYEHLQELAESIKKIGVRNAIEVFKTGEKYRIITGERRFLASILAGLQYIPSRICPKPDAFKLRYIQWAENINREDLSLFEKYQNLLAMAQAYENLYGVALTPAVLKDILGTSVAQSYRYFALLNAAEEIITLIQEKKIINLKVVDELERLKNKEQRMLLLQHLKNGSKEHLSLQSFKEMSAKPSSKLAVQLGKITNPKAAQELFHLILQDMRLAKYRSMFKGIDWSSHKKISNAFIALTKILDKEFQC